MTIATEKLTISLPHDILVITDTIAKERNLSRSKIVYYCLLEMAEKHLQERMAEGYKQMAKEHLKSAEAFLPVANEILR